MPVIRFQKVSKLFPGGERPALDRVTVNIDEGEFVYLVGQSGSGKSTALSMVLREERPSEGRVYVAGKEVSRMGGWRVPKLRRQIGTVFQDYKLLATKTVAENVAFAQQVVNKPKREVAQTVPAALELVGLGDKGGRMPNELSGGEQQRVAIARAFVNGPTILIADEPTGNLDPSTSQEILHLLEEINARGTTVLMATHDNGLVDRNRKRVVELVDGHVRRDDATGRYTV